MARVDRWAPSFDGVSGGVWACIFSIYAICSRNVLHLYRHQQTKRNLYTGHTDDITARVFEHKEKAYKGFSAKYGCDKLVWFELHETRDGAFKRERQIKKWNRAWKLDLIENLNPSWEDLYEGLTEENVYCALRRFENYKFLKIKA